MTGAIRGSVEADALRTDQYLDVLLAQRDRAGMPGTPPGVAPAGADLPDRALRSTIEALDRALVRVHPSFRFEERLARRLAEVADAMRLSDAAGAEGASVPVVLPFDPALDPGADPAEPPGLVAPSMLLPAVPRPLLIGAASAALSLAGAALVAWRFGRPGDPMARAVRAAHQLRVAGRAHPARVD